MKVEAVVGKRVLCRVGENDAIRQAGVEAISPNGRFVRLGGPRIADDQIGWVMIHTVEIVDVLSDKID